MLQGRLFLCDRFINLVEEPVNLFIRELFEVRLHQAATLDSAGVVVGQLIHWLTVVVRHDRRSAFVNVRLDNLAHFVSLATQLRVASRLEARALALIDI